MAIGDLDTVQKVAIKKVITDTVFDGARALLAPGSYEADISVRIAGNVRVGEPYPQAIAMTFPWQRLALMLATRVPRHVLDSVMRDIRNDGALEDLKDHVIGLWGKIRAGTEQQCSGKITSQLTVELVSKDEARA